MDELNLWFNQSITNLSVFDFILILMVIVMLNKK